MVSVSYERSISRSRKNLKKAGLLVCNEASTLKLCLTLEWLEPAKSCECAKLVLLNLKVYS